MAKEFNVGDRVFIPAKITKEICSRHYKAEFFVGKDETKIESFDAKVGTLFTAKQVSDKYIDGPTYDDLKTERDTLKMMLAERDRLLASANADITTLKSENERLSKQNEELGAKVDNLEVELNNARAAIDLLQEENNKLKREVAERDELLSDAADRIKTLEEAADRSIFFEKIANQQEVIDALVEKIRRLEGGET